MFDVETYRYHSSTVNFRKTCDKTIIDLAWSTHRFLLETIVELSKTGEICGVKAVRSRYNLTSIFP